MRPLVRTDTEAGDWGSPALDPAVVSDPTSSTAASTTAATQAANEAERVALALSQLPPPPFGVAFVGPDGQVTQTWMSWLTRLYTRSGGATATSASDLDVLTEFDDLPQAPRPVDSVLDWMQSLGPDARVALLAQQVDALTGLVLSFQSRGWNRQAALTAAAAAAPAGGTGTAAGGWDTAVNRDAAIATINNLRTRLGEVEAALKAVRIL
jgi:hypothetical protein